MVTHYIKLFNIFSFRFTEYLWPSNKSTQVANSLHGFGSQESTRSGPEDLQKTFMSVKVPSLDHLPIGGQIDS